MCDRVRAISVTVNSDNMSKCIVCCRSLFTASIIHDRNIDCLDCLEWIHHRHILPDFFLLAS